MTLQYRPACWDPFRQINALDWVQKKVAKFANSTKHSNWETLAQCRKHAYVLSTKRTLENQLGRL
jgi:hypothetical protein